MKLEVGQKIGIYEIIAPIVSKRRTSKICIGFDDGEGIDSMPINLFHKELGFENPYYYKPSEVRKVGALIVKRLKVTEPPKH